MLFNPVGIMQTLGALFVVFAMALVVGTALGFEHIGGYIPCKLCLAQREPYYAAIPVALFSLISIWLKWPGYVARISLLIVGLFMSYGVYLGVYHAGVEWAWWPGPLDCGAASTSGITTDASDLLGAIDAQTPPSCDEAAGRFLGLSFAGWNVIASVGLAAVAFQIAISNVRRSA